MPRILSESSASTPLAVSDDLAAELEPPPLVVQGVGAGAAQRASAPLTTLAAPTLVGRGARVAAPRAPLAPSMGQRSDKPGPARRAGGHRCDPMDDRRFRMLRWAWRWRADYHPNGWRYARLWEMELREMEGVRL